MTDPISGVLVPVELMQSVVNYLAGQPYRDVANTIHALQSCRPIQIKQEDEDVRDAADPAPEGL